MMRSMFSAVSGLKTHQVRMDVIGNNVANVNTVGFKAGRVSFYEMFSQTMRGASAPTTDKGGTNPQQVGLGVTIASIDSIHEQGNLQSTAKTTDMAIQGSGFFLVRDQGNSMYFTRAGAFDLDGSGNLVDPRGRRVLGWQAVNGVFGPRDSSTLTAIQIPVGQVIGAVATSNVIWGHNLDARAAVGFERNTSVDVFDSLGRAHSLSMTFRRTDGARETTRVAWGNSLSASGPIGTVVTQDVTLYDDLGRAVSVTVRFEKTGAAQWSVSSTGPTGLSGGSGTITFDPVTGAYISDDITDIEYSPQGASAMKVDLDFIGVTEGAAGDIAVTSNDGAAAGSVPNEWAWTASGPAGITGNSGFLTFDAGGRLSSATGGPVTFTPMGANPVSIAMSFWGVTQNAGESTVECLDRDGNPMGTLGKITIDASGVITGTYSNGQSQKIAQIALAAFANPAGLTRTGDNLYQSSNNSGQPQIGEAGTGGRGNITPSALEMSNVDLAEEFTNMIVTQRGFQANSRVITASDEMLQDLVNLRR